MQENRLNTEDRKADIRRQVLLKLIREDMKPALGMKETERTIVEIMSR